jgi:hypothetical protein
MSESGSDSVIRRCLINVRLDPFRTQVGHLPRSDSVPEAIVGPLISITSPSRPGGEFPLRRQAAPAPACIGKRILGGG